MPKAKRQTKESENPRTAPSSVQVLPVEEPNRRLLKIYAFDPMLGRTAQNRITIDIANEDLDPGPSDSRIAVIDYDSNRNRYYSPVDLNDPAILMQDGLEPSESDPRFHQQMTYAVTKKVIENFDISLGRRISFRNLPGRKLRLYPHAFYGSNAFYSRDLGGVAFGYFTADKKDPGPNIPGQTIFTCLSHDIVAHEVTHALISKLRRQYDHSTNADVPAFHEGFSDIVAIFQHFSFENVLANYIRETRGDLRTPKPLIELAQQFGYATGGGQALRTSIGNPNPKLYQKVIEPHDRGSILVAAVFDGFFSAYEKRIQPLIRIASEGTGILPPGELHPQLVELLAQQAAASADAVLKTCIRSFEYLPSVDLTYGDFLRALVTADREYNPKDPYDLRASLIEAFRKRGIYPYGVGSLSEESLCLEEDPDGLPQLDVSEPGLRDFIFGFTNYYSSPGAQPGMEEKTSRQRASTVRSNKPLNFTDVYKFIHAYAEKNRAALDLHPTIPVLVESFHPTIRVGRDGRLLVELVAVLSQTDPNEEKLIENGGVPTLGGTTITFRWDGSVRYIISKPLESAKISQAKQNEAKMRMAATSEFIEQCDTRNKWLTWADDEYRQQRIVKTMSVSAIHGNM